MKSQNAIIAYRHFGDGKLLPVLAGPFFTGGSGVSNPGQIMGPNESDGEIKISNDRKFLLAVNSGSNTIAVFKIYPDGTLSAVPGSPFPSGGETPVSIDQWQQYVFVLNKSNNPLQPSTQKPNYITFMLQGDGSLTPVAGGTFETTQGSSPAQVLASRTHGFVFGSDLMANTLNAPQGTLRSFTIGNSGVLTPVAGSPYTIPDGGAAFGLWQNPVADVLYVTVPNKKTIASYSIDPSTGVLTFKNNDIGTSGVSRIRTNGAGTRLFGVNTATNSVIGYSMPVPTAVLTEGQLTLKNSGPTYTIGGNTYTSSGASSLAVSSNDKWLFVVSQHTNPDFGIGNYNFLHAISWSETPGFTFINFAEPNDPVQLPVPNTVRPRGIAVLQLN